MYRNLPDRSIVALIIDLDDAGKVHFTAGEGHAEQALGMVKEGVAPFGVREPIRPEEGADYIRAVYKTYSVNSTLWTAVPVMPGARIAPGFEGSTTEAADLAGRRAIATPEVSGVAQPSSDAPRARRSGSVPAKTTRRRPPATP